MHQRKQHRGLSIHGAIFAGLAALLSAGAASAQTATPNPTLPAGQGYLVLQDFSDCTNANVSKVDTPSVGGYVWVTRMPDGNTGVKVAMTATPRTTYHFFLKCVRLLGDITTDNEGVAVQSFSFPTPAGSVFAFDMYPEGAPAGDKYQSSQISLP
jgi:hypothetical protein